MKKFNIYQSGHYAITENLVLSINGKKPTEEIVLDGSSSVDIENLKSNPNDKKLIEKIKKNNLPS